VSVERAVTPKFVGRDEELVALDDALERARGGEPAVEELRAVAGGFPEVRAHGLAAHAELSRLADVPDPAAWVAASSAWEELGRPYDIAYARWRQAEALARRRGRRDEVADALARAHEAASQVGAARLLAEIERLARRSRIAIGDRSGDEVDVFP
jgi:hypothetical protein